MSLENVVETDVLVIGGGIAGCFAAIKAKEQGADVTLVDKGYVGKTGMSPSATRFLVFNPEWGHDLDAWMNQVSFIGEYMNDLEWTEITLKESYAAYQDLVSWGVEFLKKPNGEFVLAPVRAPDQPELEKFPMQALTHWRRKDIETLRVQLIKVGVRIMDKIMISDLLKQDGQIVGAIGTSCSTDSYIFYIFKAKATIMAAGTAALKPDGIALHAVTGDAEAMAYRVGCEITGKEWNEHWHRSAEFPGRRSGHLPLDVSFLRPGDEARTFWAYNAEGDFFIDEETLKWGNPSIMPSIFEAHAGRAPIFFDNSDPNLRRRTLLGFAERDRIPEGVQRLPMDVEAERIWRTRVVIGGGFGMSTHNSEGIWPINKKCATQVPGLFAAGDSCGARQSGVEYCSMGYAGAACAVTGTRAARGAVEYASQMRKKPAVDREELARLKGILYAPAERKGGFSPGWTTQVLRNLLMPYWILYYKHEKRLQSAIVQVEFIRDHIVPKLYAKDPHELRLAIETKNMVLNAEMKLRASLFRTESRGNHYREDYPRRDDPNWLAWIKIKEEDGEMKLSKEPIPKKWWPDLSLPYKERYPMAGE